jgi:hypothetical protein
MGLVSCMFQRRELIAESCYNTEKAVCVITGRFMTRI